MKLMTKHSGTRLSESELVALIERYFDCATSEEEEVRLKQELAVTEHRNNTIEEAMATVGVFAEQKRLMSAVKRSRGAIVAWRVVSVAAVVALLFAVGLHMLSYNGNEPEDYCIAYVNGVAVNDRAEVMAMLHSELTDVSSAGIGEDVDLLSRLSAFGGLMEESDE